MAYCLFGLFDVNLPLLYGEGGRKAFLRLQEEIFKRTLDMTLLLWCPDHADTFQPGRSMIMQIGALCTHPRFFHPVQAPTECGRGLDWAQIFKPTSHHITHSDNFHPPTVIGRYLKANLLVAPAPYGNSRVLISIARIIKSGLTDR